MLNSFLCLTVLGVLLSFSQAMATNCVNESHCRSQLLRVEVASNALGGNGGDQILQALQSFATSPTLTNMIQRSYDIKTLPFPHFKDVCTAEQSENDPDFRGLNCQGEGLCADPNLNPKVRERICFRLPCSILEGTLHVGKCQSVEYIYPSQISFPGKLELRNIKLTPTRRSFEKNRAEVCFNINSLELNLNTKLSLNTTGTNLPDKEIQVDSINPRMSSPREACFSANVNLASVQPISNISLTYTNGPFITDDMLDDAVQRIKISGLSGYPANELRQVQTDVVPPLVQTLRSELEKGVVDGLQKTFQEELENVIGPLTSTRRGQSAFVESSDFLSEFGYANRGHQETLDVSECTLTLIAGKQIPANHACLNYRDFNGKPYRFNTIGENDAWFAIGAASGSIKGRNVTSESIKRRLIAMQALVKEIPMPPFSGNETPAHAQQRRKKHEQKINDLLNDLQKIIDDISANQVAGPIFNFMEFQREGSSVRVGVPEICDTVKPSRHSGRRMANCPIQVYADLNEFNEMLERLWKGGRICQKGRGGFVGATDAEGKQLYRRGRSGTTNDPNVGSEPISTEGCQWDMGGMSCFIKAPPRIEYNAPGKNYKISLGLEKCYREAGISTFWIGTFGGDLNIDVTFQPGACNGGDFCMEKPEANWSVVKGSERYALRPDSFVRGKVDAGLTQSLNNALGESIRLPMGSVLGNVPLRSEGRVDRGPGFFGVCLEVQSGNGSTP